MKTMGEPLARPHNERFDELADNARARWKETQRRADWAQAMALARRAKREGRPAPIAWTPEELRRQQVRALRVQVATQRRYDRWVMLQHFFLTHGDIFKELKK